MILIRFHLKKFIFNCFSLFLLLTSSCCLLVFTFLFFTSLLLGGTRWSAPSYGGVAFLPCLFGAAFLILSCGIPVSFCLCLFSRTIIIINIITNTTSQRRGGKQPEESSTTQGEEREKQHHQKKDDANRYPTGPREHGGGRGETGTTRIRSGHREG